jgi:hypothetical protein
MSRLRLALRTLVATTAFAAPAGAATVSFTTNTIHVPATPPKPTAMTVSTQVLTIVAAPGQPNRAVVTLAADGERAERGGYTVQTG